MEMTLNTLRLWKQKNVSQSNKVNDIPFQHRTIIFLKAGGKGLLCSHPECSIPTSHFPELLPEFQIFPLMG